MTALPIKKVRLSVQGQTVEPEAKDMDSVISLTLHMKKGKTQLKTAFLDSGGEVLAGITKWMRRKWDVDSVITIRRRQA